MTKEFYSVVLVTAMLLSAPAAAGNTQGPGAIDCGQWLDKRKADDYLQEFSWVQGYISAFNALRNKDVFGDVSPETLEAFLDEYCLDNPSNYLFDATNAFIYRER